MAHVRRFLEAQRHRSNTRRGEARLAEGRREVDVRLRARYHDNPGCVQLAGSVHSSWVQCFHVAPSTRLEGTWSRISSWIQCFRMAPGTCSRISSWIQCFLMAPGTCSLISSWTQCFRMATGTCSRISSWIQCPHGSRDLVSCLLMDSVFPHGFRDLVSCLLMDSVFPHGCRDLFSAEVQTAMARASVRALQVITAQTKEHICQATREQQLLFEQYQQIQNFKKLTVSHSRQLR